jgi:thiol-disulfide isomerase/thioredoxin
MLILTFFVSVTHAQGVGTTAPAFRLVDAFDQPIALADTTGEPVVLNVWATWCPPCRAELPLFEQAQATLAGEVTFLLLNNNERAEAAAQFLTEEGITLLAAFEPTRAQRNQFDLDTTRDVVRDYRVRGMPTTFFIDADGIIQAVKVGEVRQAELTELLATIGVMWPQDSAVTSQHAANDNANVADSDSSNTIGDSVTDSVMSINTPQMTVLGAVHGRISSQSSQTQPLNCGDHCPTQPVREDAQ